MDFEQLYRMCTQGYDQGFAIKSAADIMDAHAVDSFLNFVEYAVSRQKEERNLCFRAFYVLEHIYLSAYPFTSEQKVRLFQWIPRLHNRSAHRHISKLFSLEVQSCIQHKSPALPLSEEQTLLCVESLAEWLIEEKSKVAVQIWALEALLQVRAYCVFAQHSLRGNKQVQACPKLEALIQEILPACLDIFASVSTPGKQCRLKAWRETGLL